MPTESRNPTWRAKERTLRRLRTLRVWKLPLHGQLYRSEATPRLASRRHVRGSAFVVLGKVFSQYRRVSNGYWVNFMASHISERLLQGVVPIPVHDRQPMEHSFNNLEEIIAMAENHPSRCQGSADDLHLHLEKVLDLWGISVPNADICIR